MPGFGKVKETRCNTDLRQLLRDPSEDMVVQVPGLCQILDVARQLVLAAPLLSLSKITAVRLKSTMHRQLSYQMSCCRLIFLPTDCTKEKNVKKLLQFSTEIFFWKTWFDAPQSNPGKTTPVKHCILNWVKGFTSHLTQNRSLWRHSSLQISWLSTEKTKPNTTKANSTRTQRH